MNRYSDMAQTVAALAPFAAGPTTLRNLAHVRLQETDRLHAMATELRRLGQEVEEWPDGLRIQPRPVRPATVQTYGDHRMAMAFAVVGLRASGIRLADPTCVSKTFPDYSSGWRRCVKRQTSNVRVLGQDQIPLFHPGTDLLPNRKKRISFLIPHPDV